MLWSQEPRQFVGRWRQGSFDEEEQQLLFIKTYKDSLENVNLKKIIVENW